MSNHESTVSSRPDRQKVWTANQIEKWNTGLNELELVKAVALSTSGATLTFTENEIAEACGVSQQAVNMMVKRALKKLRPALASVKRDFL